MSPGLLELRRWVINVISNIHYRDDIAGIRQKGKSGNWCYKKESMLNFQKNEQLLTPGTHTYLSVSVG